MRKTQFITGEYYHIYNRGVDKRQVFMDESDTKRFLISMNLLKSDDIGLMLKWRDSQKVSSNSNRTRFLEFQEPGSEKSMVDVVAYCLNPNHYHFILKQLSDNGISKFMHKLGASYGNYFNKKHSRSGSLFQGPFKSIHIDSNEYLLYLSVYVNMNYEIHGYGSIASWPYSSYADYVGKRTGKLCNKEIILSQFNNNLEDYNSFLKLNASYLKEKKDFAKYILE